MAYLREGQGSTVDKVDQQLNKAISAIQKAQSAVLDAADAMDAVMVDAVACGGKVAELVPSHLKMHIAKLTDIADTQLGGISEGDNQSSLNKLKDLIGNIPYRDLRQPSAEDRRAQMATQPNLTAGPQSQIKAQESLEEFYRDVLKEDARNYQYEDKVFSFNVLKESGMFGEVLDSDVMNQFQKKPGEVIAKVDRSKLQEKMRVSAEDAMFEDKDLDELQESGPLNFNNISAFGGSDGMPLKFDSLSDGGHIV
jgi:hypothetical protein